MKDELVIKGYPPYPPIINFFMLRPELMLFIICFILLFSFVRFFSWTEKKDDGDFVDLSRFEMVEIKIPVSKEQEPEIVTPDEAEDVVEEKTDEKEEAKKQDAFKFGDDSGHYDISALAATPPKAKNSTPPPYPSSMQKQGVEGTVIVELGIDEQGNVIYGKIKRKVHPVLDRIVINWVRRLSFYPAMDGKGKPFRCKIFMPVRFQLE